MSTFTLSLLRADDPKMSSARLFASSVYLDRHDATNTSPPDWTILLEDKNGPCATFSVFDPATHSPLFFSRLFEKEWEMIKKQDRTVAEVGARAIARRDDPVYTANVPIILAGALALSMDYMGYSSFVCVADRLLARLARNIGVSCIPLGRANPSLLPPEIAHTMRNYFAAGPSGYEVCGSVDYAVLLRSFTKSTDSLGVDCSLFVPLHTEAA